MAESVVCGIDVYDLGKGDFYATFNMEPEKLINNGTCWETVLVKLLEPTEEEKCTVKILSLLDEQRNVRNQKMFYTEVKLMQSFDHPYLMKCIIAAQCTDYMAISSRYYQRGTLRRYVGGLSHQLTELCVTQVACALRYMHKRNCVHLDVQLESIFMDEDFNAVLGDLGQAMELVSEQQTVCKSQCVGTPGYLAPELRGLLTKKQVDPYKLDSYCLGVVMYALIFEKNPATNISYYFEARKHQDLPRNVRYWLLKLLERDPSKRMTATDILTKVRRESEYRYVIDNY